MFLVLFVMLVAAWLLGWGAFHVAGGLIHLLLIVAVISLLVHFRARPWSRGLEGPCVRRHGSSTPSVGPMPPTSADLSVARFLEAPRGPAIDCAAARR